MDVALQWNAGYTETVLTFANNINTHEGGTHEEGFRKALTRAVNEFAREKGLLKEKDENLVGEDIREGLTAVVAVRVRHPQFEGQTKTKLGNTEVRSFVEVALNRLLPEWLEPPPGEGRAIVDKCGTAARARMAARAARDLTRRKSLLESTGLPGKLADCSARDPGVERVVHRRGRLGRRLGQAGAQQRVPGDPPHPGQDHQRREGPPHPGAAEQRDPGADHRHRHRHRRRLRPRRGPATTRW